MFVGLGALTAFLTYNIIGIEPHSKPRSICFPSTCQILSFLTLICNPASAKGHQTEKLSLGEFQRSHKTIRSIATAVNVFQAYFPRLTIHKAYEGQFPFSLTIIFLKNSFLSFPNSATIKTSTATFQKVEVSEPCHLQQYQLEW